MASAKLSRSSGSLLTLLLHCASVGPLAAAAGVVNTCTEALVDTWLRTPSKFFPAAGQSLGGREAGGPGSAFTLQGSAFTPMKPPPSSSSSTLAVSGSAPCPGGEVAEESTLRSLCRLPEDWLASLLAKALERGVPQSLLAQMAVRYVSQAIDKDGAEARNGEASPLRSASVNGHSTPIHSAGSPDDTAPTAEDLDKDVDSARGLGDEEEEEGVVSAGDGLPPIPERAVDLGQLLDTVLTTLPEEAYNLPSLTIEWLTKVGLSRQRLVMGGMSECLLWVVVVVLYGVDLIDQQQVVDNPPFQIMELVTTEGHQRPV